ncbi:MAG: ferrous iron transport protein B [Desulfurococcaceae archaeon]|nr:ferrous iron transport protein B [Desulfurococcaceae archaeon]
MSSNERMTKGYDVTVAIVGNPNVGKSTLFNVLTGELAHVSNWPGTTVARKEGVREWMGVRIRFVDLPGIYGLSASTLEEVITREYVVNERPDLIVVLVDATIPERSLYLPIQLLELTPNVVIVFTKVDEMSRLGIHIHFDKLEAMLGVPVIPTSAIKGVGIRDLLNTIVELTRSKRKFKELVINYGGLEPFINEISKIVVNSKVLKPYPTRWVAIRLLEGDKRLEELLMSSNELDILNSVLKVRESVRRSIGRDPSELAIGVRYEFVSSIAKEVVVRVERKGGSEELIAEVFQKPVLGVLASSLLLLTSFMLIFTVNTGFPLNMIFKFLGLEGLAEFLETYSLSGVLGHAFNVASDYVRGLLHYNPVLASLISDGVLVGVGAVLSFLPLILMIFFLLALLEDSGLAPRMAVSFHNLLSRFGFSGSSIYPMLIGVGCNVPAVMGSRILLDDVERRQVIFSVPFIPCQARFIVTSALVVSYFKSPTLQAVALLSIYLVGVLTFLLSSLLVRRVVYKVRESPELILELPLIHTPKLKVVWWITWDYTKHFLRKAGLIILTLSVVIWFITNLGPNGYVGDITESFGAMIGRFLAPILTPFDIPSGTDWVLALALFQGFVAKESVLDTLAILYGTADISEAINSLGLTIPQAYALILFITLYIPCLATVAVVYQESRSLKMTMLQVIYMVGLAYITALTTYYILKII